MRLGKVLTYKDVDEARRLIGKKVVASDFYASICDDDTACDCMYDTLKAVHADKVCPFECITFYGTQFIREILDEAKYEPYDLSDKKVRDSLRGRWYKWEGPDGTGEEMVTRFLLSPCTKKWEISGFDGEWFLKHCHWIDDGTPCGRRMDKEMSSQY